MGYRQLTTLVEDLPKSFEKFITRKAVIPKKDEKGLRIGGLVVCNTEAIYVKIMYLINLEKGLNYKLLPILTALFHGHGNMRYLKAESILKSKWFHLVETMYQYIQARLVCQDFYFVFDRYFLYNIKGSTQENKIHNIPNHHYFSLLMALPGREKDLSSSSSTRFQYSFAITGSQYTLIKIRTSKTVTDIGATVQK